MNIDRDRSLFSLQSHSCILLSRDKPASATENILRNTLIRLCSARLLWVHLAWHPCALLAATFPENLREGLLLFRDPDRKQSLPGLALWGRPETCLAAGPWLGCTCWRPVDLFQGGFSASARSLSACLWKGFHLIKGRWQPRPHSQIRHSIFCINQYLVRINVKNCALTLLVIWWNCPWELLCCSPCTLDRRKIIQSLFSLR